MLIWPQYECSSAMDTWVEIERRMKTQRDS
jgi:hypothetical protein